MIWVNAIICMICAGIYSSLNSVNFDSEKLSVQTLWDHLRYHMWWEGSTFEETLVTLYSIVFKCLYLFNINIPAANEIVSSYCFRCIGVTAGTSTCQPVYAYEYILQQRNYTRWQNMTVVHSDSRHHLSSSHHNCPQYCWYPAVLQRPVGCTCVKTRHHY